MRQTKIMPAAIADAIPLPDAGVVSRKLAEARASFHRKIVVLDDDPTGTQTVHGVPVYTHWDRRTLEEAFAETGAMFFILTNSRSFTAAETERVHREIAQNLAAASRTAGIPFLLVSRGDSTLRGHYPLETQVLREELETELHTPYDGEILMPYFSEGNRFTIDNIHYMKSGENLIPVGMTEFARDTAFSFSSSDLAEWCEERSGGRYRAGDVAAISLEELRGLDYAGILAKLARVHGFGKVAVNAADDLDAEVFATALFLAMQEGKEFLIRSAAGLVRILGGIPKRPPLKREELCLEDSPAGGLVIVGSHVQKTTEQLECLLASGMDLEPICFRTESVFRPAGLQEESSRVLRLAETAIRSGRTAVVYTSRQVLRSREDSSQDNLRLSVQISRSLTSIVKSLTVRPSFLVAKGGITSYDVGIRGLGVRRAWVMGQAAPGVPVWRTGEESRFPNMGYVIFPGNVGDKDTLRAVVWMLAGRMQADGRPLGGRGLKK